MEWNQVRDEDVIFYKGSYKENGILIIAVYNYKGRILKEIREFNKSLVTLPMRDKAREIFPESKIDFLRRVVFYSRKATVKKSVYYELVLKKKKTNLSVYFDEDQHYIENDNIVNLANN